MRRCWHCTFPVEVDPPSRTVDGVEYPTFAGIPIAVEERAGSPIFRLYGLFHDLSCARAFLEASEARHRLRHLFRSYARDVWGGDPPPPALPRTLLRDFGGPYSWADWRARALRQAGAWQQTDRAEAAAEGIGRQNAADVSLQHRFRLSHEFARRVEPPGRSDLLMDLIDFQGADPRTDPRTI